MHMTKRQLIEALEQVEDDVQIILSSDGEGNSFSPLDDITVELYKPNGREYGELGDMEEENLPYNSIVLWPVS